jgi:hypothetical protein
MFYKFDHGIRPGCGRRVFPQNLSSHFWQPASVSQQDIYDAPGCFAVP